MKELVLFIIILILVVIILYVYLNRNTEFFYNIDEAKDLHKDLKVLKNKLNNKGLKINMLINEETLDDKQEKVFKQVIEDYDNYNFHGAGVAITGSGKSYRYVVGIFINLYLIRNVHHSMIPIEIYYVGLEEKFEDSIIELYKSFKNIEVYNLIDKLNIGLKDYDIYNDQNKINELRGYQSKPITCLCSSFANVILLDADSICFRDPYEFFKIEGFDSHGMVLFKDYVKCLTYVSKPFLDTIGLSNYCKVTGDLEIDSSCVIVNKKRAWDALHAICLINIKSHMYYKHKFNKYNYLKKDNVLGDKDTWLIGALFVGFEPYIDKSVNPLHFIIDNVIIDGHYQSGSIDGTVVPLYYNNQQFRLSGLSDKNSNRIKVIEKITGKKYEQSVIGSYVPTEVITSLMNAKIAQEIIQKYLPKELKGPLESESDSLYYDNFIPS
jgi:hypothetical protein